MQQLICFFTMHMEWSKIHYYQLSLVASRLGNRAPFQGLPCTGHHTPLVVRESKRPKKWLRFGLSSRVVLVCGSVQQNFMF